MSPFILKALIKVNTALYNDGCFPSWSSLESVKTWLAPEAELGWESLGQFEIELRLGKASRTDPIPTLLCLIDRFQFLDLLFPP